MVTKARHHGVTYSLKREYLELVQVRRREFKTQTQGSMRVRCVTIDRIKLTDRDSNKQSNRSEKQANMRTIIQVATIKAVIMEP